MKNNHINKALIIYLDLTLNKINNILYKIRIKIIQLNDKIQWVFFFSSFKTVKKKICCTNAQYSEFCNFIVLGVS